MKRVCAYEERHDERIEITAEEEMHTIRSRDEKKEEKKGRKQALSGRDSERIGDMAFILQFMLEERRRRRDVRLEGSENEASMKSDKAEQGQRDR